tara:strand:- start:74 stop:427 length:354 start_codon:yes stop_codon:yes gene_type:complete
MTYESKRRINAFLDIPTGSAGVLYTCPTNRTAVVKEIIVSNVDGSASANLTIQIVDTSTGNTFNLVSTKPVAQNTYLRIDSANIILESGDILKALASAADDLEASAFIEEYPDPMRS